MNLRTKGEMQTWPKGIKGKSKKKNHQKWILRRMTALGKRPYPAVPIPSAFHYLRIWCRELKMKYNKGYLSLACRYFEGKIALYIL